VFSRVDFARGVRFDTRDPDEARRLCASALLPHELQVEPGERAFRAHGARIDLGPMSLCRLSWQARVTVDAGRLDDDYLLCLPIRGAAEYRQGRSSFVATQSTPALVGGGEPFSFTACADYEPLLLRLRRTAVEAAWAALCGESRTRPIRFASTLPTGSATWRSTEPVLQMLAAAAGGEPGLLRIFDRLQDLLLTTLLISQPHTAHTYRSSSGATSTARVRRVQEFMLERLGYPLTLSMVANEAGMPARTLQLAFKCSEGMGPMQWLRQQRLAAARSELLSPREGSARVSDIALKFGFGHLGEFSQTYRRMFGECPSETLRRTAAWGRQRT
jgi:AraC-like DNA-binding protein